MICSEQIFNLMSVMTYSNQWRLWFESMTKFQRKVLRTFVLNMYS